MLLSDCCAGRPAGGAGRGVGTGHRAGLGRCSGPQRRQGRAPAPVTVAVFCPFTQVGKRRGGNKLALKTGIVAKKQKTEDEVSRLVVAGTASVAFPSSLSSWPRCPVPPSSVSGPWMDVLGGGGGGLSTQLLDNLTLLIFISDPICCGGVSCLRTVLTLVPGILFPTLCVSLPPPSPNRY